MVKKARKTPTAKQGKSQAATEKKTAKSTKAATVSSDDFAKTLNLQNYLTTALEETMTKNTNQFDTFTKDATAASREYFEAVTQSYKIFAKGYEGLIRTSVELSQSTAEKQAAYAKEALSCKTVNEFAEIQNKIAQSNFDDFMSSVTKLSEISTKVITESAEPISEQVNKAVEKITKVAA